ncbi:MAG: aminotransferase class III-fold pyridoxal phosphate-dependent enzyme, partial [Actinomycetia bacterium]|nr:aminotransferase class III-fold pyridoxal phosphate-dependent enzyme [Actinomycetes bacterium]
MIGLAMLSLAREHVHRASAETKGARLKMGLTEAMNATEIIGDVRGRGLLLGTEFVIDRGSMNPAPQAATAVADACRRRGLLIQVVSGNVWRIAPPLTVSNDEVDSAVSIIQESITEYEHV